MEDARAILHHGLDNGMDTLDTAIAYGDSETRLGEVGVSRWRVVSKLPAVPETTRDIGGWVAEQAEGSLRRLRVDRLYAMLLHRPDQLLADSGEALYRALVALRDRGLAQKIGISIYGPSELEAILSRYALDMVQTPFNVLDRRIIGSGWLGRLRDAGVELHARSVFLQGLLLMSRRERPKRFARWQHTWDLWDTWLEKSEMSPLSACLRFALSVPEIDRVVVGVDSLRHLIEVLSAAEGRSESPPSALSVSDPTLLNPATWNTIG